MTLIISHNEPLYIALDVTGSMLKREPDGNTVRFAYARQRLEELLQRLPREMLVSVLSVGSELYVRCKDAPALQARSALSVLEANAATCCPGLALEWALTRLYGQQRATLLLVTDGIPDDLVRYDAYASYNAQLRDNALAIHVLCVGDEPWFVAHDPARNAFSAIGRSERHSIQKLSETELMVGKPASSPPGVPLAHADTQPPSVAPPERPHAPPAAAAKKGGKK